jgi:hypothetical protein
MGVGVFVACATVAVLVSACPSNPAGTRGGAASATPTPLDTAPTPFDTAVTALDSLSLELVLPHRVRAGEPVPIELRVQNLTRRSLDLYLRGRAVTWDVIVARRGGDVVWRRLEDEIIPAIVHLRTLAPGERLEADAVWNQRTNQGRRVEAGEYTARGLLLVDGEPLQTASVPFAIEQ